MQKSHRIVNLVLSAVIFIILEITALKMLNNNAKVQAFFINKKVHYFMAKVWGLNESLEYYLSLRKMNENLELENFKLKEQLRAYQNYFEEDKAKAENLKNIQGLEKGQYSYFPAIILKNSINKAHNYLIINKGSEDSIKVNSGIICNNAVVGIIESVSKHYSYAKSFFNNDFALSVRIGRKGATGLLYWNEKEPDMAVLKDISLQNKFAPGDSIFTSGYSSIFPADIPIGSITDAKIIDGSSYEINVHLFNDFSSLRYVSIVQNNRREELENLENTANDK